MCFITYVPPLREDQKTKEVAQEIYDYLHKSECSNSDGNGVGWFDMEGTAHTYKGTSMIKLLEKVWNEPCSSGWLFHARIGTMGDKTTKNMHPFILQGENNKAPHLLAHNGHFRLIGHIEQTFRGHEEAKLWSDTRYVAEYLNKFGVKKIKALKEAHTLMGNTVVIMSRGEVIVYNDNRFAEVNCKSGLQMFASTCNYGGTGKSLDDGRFELFPTPKVEYAKPSKYGAGWSYGTGYYGYGDYADYGTYYPKKKKNSSLWKNPATVQTKKERNLNCFASYTDATATTDFDYYEAELNRQKEMKKLYCGLCNRLRVHCECNVCDVCLEFKPNHAKHCEAYCTICESVTYGSCECEQILADVKEYDRNGVTLTDSKYCSKCEKERLYCICGLCEVCYRNIEECICKHAKDCECDDCCISASQELRRGELDLFGCYKSISGFCEGTNSLKSMCKCSDCLEEKGFCKYTLKEIIYCNCDKCTSRIKKALDTKKIKEKTEMKIYCEQCGYPYEQCMCDICEECGRFSGDCVCISEKDVTEIFKGQVL